MCDATCCPPLRLRGTRRNSGLRCFSVLPSTFKNTEVPSPDSLGSRATCPSDDRRLRLNRGIATRDFDVHATLCTRQPRYADMQWQTDSSVHLRVDSLAAPPRSDGLQGLKDLLDSFKLSILFPLKSSPLYHLHLCRRRKRTNPPELLRLLGSFWKLPACTLCGFTSTTLSV
jgi:hypothetical protein